jgi:hypothetical protein
MEHFSDSTTTLFLAAHQIIISTFIV